MTTLLDFQYHSEDEKNQSKQLKVTCNLNNAAFKLKLEDYKQAVKLCTKVLKLDSQNVKALYRTAQVYIQLADLQDVKLTYKNLKENVKEYNKNAKFYSNMFAKMTKQPAEVSKAGHGAESKQGSEPVTAA
ncbi:hypothetical protein GUJ93_ZPchr0008g12251 [Zizania palustris]|uniref:Peptidylprolyl isomerase n=1 Tax=Zizania palustris TaxID=103762 RepID=A0A8J5RFG0_ZIZPA|nr:hypothetical protein GUJ93_ZPchr0008g12251 [Zizania palustris]